MLKIGITGQAGFIGTHLFNSLGLFPDKFIRIPFEDVYFQNTQKLEAFVLQCDVIIHLAALNRHIDPDVIYQTNIMLVKQLINALEQTNSTPHVLFSSSTQEELDNNYGKSKREGRRLLAQWAARNGSIFTGFVIPNVYGPFGQPYYNSVVATFCYQLTHNETPRIEIDSEIKLIYVAELIDCLLEKVELQCVIKTRNLITSSEPYLVPHTASIKVSQLLIKLASFKTNYIEKGIIPSLVDPFDRNLFNTFLCYIDHASFFPFKLNLHCDERGTFVETAKLHCGGQISFSTTVSGVTRGNHFHTRKTERFVVIKGNARIDIRRIGTDKVLSFELDGKQPAFVDMPIWHTHSITNVSDEELYTIFWINEHYNSDDSDTYYEKV